MFFVWLFLYGSITLISRHYAALSAGIIPIGQLINTIILMIWLRIRRQERLLTFRFDRRLQWKRCLVGAIYMMPSVCQMVYFGIQPQTALSILGILLAVIQEEILFRGILLSWLGRFGRTVSIVASGAIFAAAHLMNPAGGAEKIDLFYQLVYAMAAGIAFAGLALSCRSLIPCIGIHFWNNLTASDSMILPTGYLLWFWLCVMIYIACGIYEIRFLNKQSMGGNSNETLH